jgi:hypothetical protein
MSKVEKKMLFICICVVFSFYSLWQSLADDNPYKQYTDGLLVNGKKPIEWNSVEGRIRLTRTKYKKPFFALAHHFSGQEYPSTCGPASARIVLSAIYEKIGRPFRKDEQHSYTKWKNGIDKEMFKMTERNVFDLYNKDDINYDIVARLKKRKGIGYDGGIDLNQLAGVIASHPNIIVEYIYTSRKDGRKSKAVELNIFRKTIKHVCANENIYMIILYNLTVSYDKQSGHYSPLVAYDDETDSVLIMDVASHYGTWIWVPLEDLFINMNPTISGSDRGYIVVQQTLLSEKERQKQIEEVIAKEEKRITNAEKDELGVLQDIKEEEQIAKVNKLLSYKNQNDGNDGDNNIIISNENIVKAKKKLIDNGKKKNNNDNSDVEVSDEEEIKLKKKKLNSGFISIEKIEKPSKSIVKNKKNKKKYKADK